MTPARQPLGDAAARWRCPKCGAEKPATGDYFPTIHGKPKKDWCRACRRAGWRKKR